MTSLGNRLPSPRSRHAFTLVELLAVIAVIGVLAAILIPTVSAVRRRAWQTTDLSNLRQLGVAVGLYATETRRVDINLLVSPEEDLQARYGSGHSGDLIKTYAGGDWSITLSRAYLEQYDLGPEPKLRAFTVNETLFPRARPGPANPNPLPWDREPLRAETFTEISSRRPVFFLGLISPENNSAYRWGSFRHLNPIYSGHEVPTPNAIDWSVLASAGSWRCPTLFGDASVRTIDYSERLRSVPADDPWWVQNETRF